MIVNAFLFLLSFFGTLYVLPHSIRKLKNNGYLAKDMYKEGRPLIPTNAGIILVFTSLLTISLAPIYARAVNFLFSYSTEVYNLQESSLAFLFVVFVYALYGLVDDLVDIGRKLKFLIPIIFSFPLISVVSVTDVWLPIYGSFNLETSFYGDILLSDIFRITVIPIYVMVVSNLVNMHSGYNGLQSGLSIIIILSICVKSIEDGTSHQVFPIFAILGSMCAFYTYNKFPSRVFEGNIGSLFFGSAMGASIVTLKLWWFGFLY